MAVAESEPRPMYGIGTVARLAGIKQDTLRAWERRYGLGASQKSDSGRRLYTQTDLEHLQIVANLVGRGFRIGEIAAMERKTLAALVAQEGMSQPGPEPGSRPRVVFAGQHLCSWLDRHPGCLSQLDALLLRLSLDEVAGCDAEKLGKVDILVLECAALGPKQLATIQRIKVQLGIATVAVLYEFSSPECLRDLAQQKINTSALPLTAEVFAATMNRLRSALDVNRGKLDVGELAAFQARIFSDAALADIAGQPGQLDCGCKNHLTGIIRSLANFEEYSSNCSVDNWSNAATHACIYAYTNQARWLMEKALGIAMEDETFDEQH